MTEQREARATAFIDEAETLSKQYNLQGCIIIQIYKDGEIGASTYGESKFKCRVLGEWVKGFIEHNLSKVPFITTFGWGHGGIPQRVPQAELDKLNPAGRAYVMRNTHPDAVECKEL